MPSPSRAAFFESEGREAAGMATAGRKTARTLDGAATTTDSSPWTGALRFEVYEENSGRHRWRLRTSDGRDLATSCESFASRDDAERAAGERRD
jgi:uncharacterized protein YegP (UPF0339 family)